MSWIDNFISNAWFHTSVGLFGGFFIAYIFYKLCAPNKILVYEYNFLTLLGGYRQQLPEQVSIFFGEKKD